MKLIFPLFLLIFSLTILSSLVRAETSVSVGMEGTVVVEIPGAPVVAKRQEPHSNLRVYLTPASEKNTEQPGKYQIHFSAELPGDYNLADYLIRVTDVNGEGQGGQVSSIPAIPVRVVSLLPSHYNGELIPAKKSPYPFFTAYRPIMISVVVLWLLCLIPLILWGRKTKKKSVEVEEAPAPTIEEILQPLMEEAANNKLDASGKARLEKATILQLQRLLKKTSEVSEDGESPSIRTPYEVIQALHKDALTSEAITILEDWLHRPISKNQPNKLSPTDHKKLAESLSASSSASVSSATTDQPHTK